MKIKICAANTTKLGLFGANDFIQANRTYYLWPISWRLQLAEYLNKLKESAKTTC